MLINQEVPRRRPSDCGEDPARSIERGSLVPLHRDSEGSSPDIAALGENARDRLARLAGSADLQGLDLFGTRVDDQDLVHLERLTGLRALYLESRMIGDAGLVHLCRLKDLRTLALTGARITDAGLVHFKNPTGLQALDLSYTGVADDGIRQLRRALPGAFITAHPAPALTKPFSARLRDGEKHLADPASCLAQAPSPEEPDSP